MVGAAPIVTTASVPSGTFGNSYTAPALTASGGTSPYTFAATGLPSGLTLNTSTGVISGTPTQSGTFIVNVTATDATTAANGGPFVSAVKALMLAVAAPTVTVTTASLPGGTFGTSYTAPALTATGGTSPYTFAATGLPSGLTLNTSTGVISGTPTQSGTFTVNVTATDATDAANGGPFVSAVKALTLAIAAADMSVDLSGLPSSGTVGTSFSGSIRCTNAGSASAAALSATCSASGLPTGLTLGPCSPAPPATIAAGSSIACSVTGIPTTVGAATVSVSTSASNDPNASNNTASATITIQGMPRLTLAVGASPSSFSAIGQVITLTYTVANSGNVPISGLTVTDTRVNPISCTATTLTAGASATCTGQIVTTAADINATRISTSATARGSFAGQSVASNAAQTTIQINTEAVRRATMSANREFLNNRANAIASSGPDTQARHERLKTPLFGGSSNTADAPAGLGGPRGNGEAPSAAMPTRPGAPSGERMRSALERDREAMLRDSATEGSPSADRLGFTGSAEDGSGRFAFSTSLAKLRAAAAAEKSQLEGKAMGLGAGVPKPETGPPAKFDIWAEGSFSYFTHERLDGRSKGHAGLFYSGADYLVLPGLLVGAMVQIDRLEQTSSIGTRSASGTGWMAGPYISARLTQNLFLDARTLLGRSSNQVDPLGAYVDRFDTTRMLAAAKLTGQWTSGALTFRPSAEVLYFSDKQAAFTNAIGIAIDSQTVRLGRFAVGPEISYRFALPSKVSFEPFVGLKGVWDFARATDTSVDGAPVDRDALRGRLEFGATFKSSSGLSVRAQGTYDGIGDSGLKSWQGRATAVVPLQWDVWFGLQ